MPRLSTKRIAVTAALLMTPLLLAACSQEGFINAEGPVAVAQRAHFYSVLRMLLIVIVPLFVALPVLLWRYRLKGGKGAYSPEWAFDWKLEWLIWGLPALVVLFMAIWLWQETYDLDPYAPVATEERIGGQEAPLVIDAIGYDWKWLFVDREHGISSINRLVIPAGRPVRFEVTSATVMQALLIPKLAGQIFAMEGMTTQLNLIADRPGRYEGRNTQYNGGGFPDQRFTVEALAPADYVAWAAHARAAPSMKADVIAELEHKGHMKPSVYGGLPPEALPRGEYPAYTGLPPEKRMTAKKEVRDERSQHVAASSEGRGRPVPEGETR